ncbi:MAG: hypothetical protein BBJ60_00260 [Desulfobacterales bacterium S7086C20]|nr:MAG: hypothetical protein BBJ60_00260 [Desulfobacterales bacterium S7086C20]
MKNHFFLGHQKEFLKGSLQADGLSFFLLVPPKEIYFLSVLTCQTVITAASLARNLLFCDITEAIYVPVSESVCLKRDYSRSQAEAV